MKTHKYFAAVTAACIACLSARYALAKPVVAKADIGEFVGLSDYLDYAYTEAGLATGAFGVSGYAAYYSALFAINECLKHPIEGETMLVSNLSSVTGRARYNNELIPVSCMAFQGGLYPYDEGGFTVCSSPAFEIRYSVFPSDQNYYDYDVAFGINNSGGACYAGISVQCFLDGTRRSFRGTIQIIDQGGVFDSWTRTVTTGTQVTYSNNFKFVQDIPTIDSSLGLSYYFASGASGNTHPIAGQFTRGTFPGGEGTPVSLDYVLNTLNPWYIEQYPDIEPYVFAPYSPEYPTDYVTGIPKDWTIINPQLPSVTHKRFTMPDFTWDTIDLSGLSQYTQSMGFWWALLGKAFEDFGLTLLVVLVLGLGVVGFVLWKLGG